MRILIAFFVNAVFNLIIGLTVAKFLGPDEYGRYSLAVGLALAVQMGLLEWLRLSAARFYSVRAQSEPAIRATLDATLLVISLAIAGTATAAYFTPWGTIQDRALLALALGTSIAIGVFDYSTALARATFNDRLYMQLIIVKNVLSLLLTTVAAVEWRSANAALLAAAFALVGSIAFRSKALRENAPIFSADRAWVETYFTYAAPLVLANLLYLAIPLGARALTAKFYGYGETGQMSLAYDIGLRALQAVGSALDILLFQIAVATRETIGAREGRAQIARNITIVLAILTPAGVGLYYITPSLAVLAAPAQYVQKFGYYLTLMTPGLVALMLIMFAVNPIFQLEKRTFPATVAALIGALSLPFSLWFLPATADAGSITLAQSISYGLALAALCFFARDLRPQWPRARDFTAILLAVALMAAVLQILSRPAPGAATLILQLTVGPIVYGAAALVLNIANFRSQGMDQLRYFFYKLRKS